MVENIYYDKDCLWDIITIKIVKPVYNLEGNTDSDELKKVKGN